MAKQRQSTTQKRKGGGQKVSSTSNGTAARTVIAPQTRTVKGSGPTSSFQQELILPVTTGASQFVLHPSNIPWLAAVAPSHQEWTLASLKVWYEPRVGTTTSGTVSAAVMEDFTEGSPISTASITRLSGSKRGAPWTPFVLSTPKSRWVPYVNKAGFDAMDVTDKLNRALGRVVVFAESDYTGLLGNIFISYDPTRSLRIPTDPSLQGAVVGPVPLAAVDFVYNETYFSSTVGLSTNNNIIGRPNLDFGSLLYIDQIWTDGSGGKTTRRSFVNPNNVTVYLALSCYFQGGYSRVASNDFSYLCTSVQTPSFYVGATGYDLWASTFVKLAPGDKFALVANREQQVNAGFSIALSDTIASPITLTAAASPPSAGTIALVAEPSSGVLACPTMISWTGIISSSDPLGFATVASKLPPGVGYTSGSFTNNSATNINSVSIVMYSTTSTAWTVKGTVDGGTGASGTDNRYCGIGQLGVGQTFTVVPSTQSGASIYCTLTFTPMAFASRTSVAGTVS